MSHSTFYKSNIFVTQACTAIRKTAESSWCHRNATLMSSDISSTTSVLFICFLAASPDSICGKDLLREGVLFVCCVLHLTVSVGRTCSEKGFCLFVACFTWQYLWEGPAQTGVKAATQRKGFVCLFVACFTWRRKDQPRQVYKLPHREKKTDQTCSLIHSQYTGTRSASHNINPTTPGQSVITLILQHQVSQS